VAKIILSFEDFKRLLSTEAGKRRITPKRYVVITDYATHFTLVPMYSTRHSHYYVIKFYDKDGTKSKEIEKYLKSLGFEVMMGEVVTVEG